MIDKTKDQEMNFITVLSFILSIISLGFVIFSTENDTLQISFVIAIILTAVVFFIFKNYSSINFLEKKLETVTAQNQRIEEQINVYDRLNKIEHFIFNKGGKNGK